MATSAFAPVLSVVALPARHGNSMFLAPASCRSRVMRDTRVPHRRAWRRKITRTAKQCRGRKLIIPLLQFPPPLNAEILRSRDSPETRDFSYALDINRTDHEESTAKLSRYRIVIAKAGINRAIDASGHTSRRFNLNELAKMPSVAITNCPLPQMHHCFRSDTANSTGRGTGIRGRSASSANRNSRYAGEGHQICVCLLYPK